MSTRSTALTQSSGEDHPSSSLDDAPEIIIKPSSGWQMIDWKELWRYRDMLYFLVWRDIKTQYAQSALGIGWAFIRPIGSMIVFTIIFGTLAQMSSDGVPYAIFSYTALAPWSYFSGALMGASNSMISGSGMFTKVYFPRLILPLNAVMNRLFDFIIALIPLTGLMIWYHQTPTLWILLLPIFVLMMMLTALGVGSLLASLAIQYRDVSYGLGFLMQFLMYASPVVYPASLVPQRFRLLYGLNPMAGVIEGFRSALLATNPMPWDLLGMGSITMLIVLFVGTMYFHRVERTFADVA